MRGTQKHVAQEESKQANERSRGRGRARLQTAPRIHTHLRDDEVARDVHGVLWRRDAFRELHCLQWMVLALVLGGVRQTTLARRRITLATELCQRILGVRAEQRRHNHAADRSRVAQLLVRIAMLLAKALGRVARTQPEARVVACAHSLAVSALRGAHDGDGGNGGVQTRALVLDLCKLAVLQVLHAARDFFHAHQTLLWWFALIKLLLAAAADHVATRHQRDRKREVLVILQVRGLGTEVHGARGAIHGQCSHIFQLLRRGHRDSGRGGSTGHVLGLGAENLAGNFFLWWTISRVPVSRFSAVFPARKAT